MIDLGADGHQPWRLDCAHQAHGFPGHAQAALHFGTDRDEFHIFPQGIGDGAVPLVAAVKPDRLPQQTSADSQANFFHQPHSPGT
jgi:hypothetical protein